MATQEDRDDDGGETDSNQQEQYGNEQEDERISSNGGEDLNVQNQGGQPQDDEKSESELLNE